MASCKECFHYDVCKIIHYPSLFGLTDDGCDHFKNKEDVVPVVRCKDCKYSSFIKSCSKYECQKGCGALKFSNDYCSYGEGKD